MFRTNSNQDRVNYSKVLLPPEGYVLEKAIGTTYSLDLEALTAVCISLGLREDSDSDLLQNPISMLNALVKVSEKILIFCEAGQIKKPSTPSPLMLLLDQMVIPVTLPRKPGKRSSTRHFYSQHARRRQNPCRAGNGPSCSTSAVASWRAATAVPRKTCGRLPVAICTR